MSELRAGGLAIMIMSLRHENVGKVVSLVAFIGGADNGPHKSRNDLWRIKATNSPIYGIEGVALPGGLTCRCPGEWLMPIDGEDFSHEDERQRELING